MATNDYQITTCWCVQATPVEIAEITRRPEDLRTWWPQFRMARLLSGETGGEGSEFEVEVKGWLPYTVRYRGRIEVARYARSFRVVTWGDFDASMECQIQQHGEYCELLWDWRVHVHKAVVRCFSFLLKPLFRSNHKWVMRQGLKGMRAELARRRV